MTEADESLTVDPEIAPQADLRPFAEAEMIVCSACLRTNPPTRATCIYCATELPGRRHAADAQSPPATAAAKTENHYILVLAPAIGEVTESAVAEAAALLHLKINELSAIVDSGKSLPLARAATIEQATLLGGQLRGLGIENLAVADEELKLETPARRIRSLEFSEDELTGVTVSGVAGVSTNWADVVLIVTGRLLVNRHEVEERRRRGRTQPVGSREMFADESVLDIYSMSEPAGWRISAGNFDFSCLGSEKGVTAFENFAAVVKLLRERAVNADFDDLYVGLRTVLAAVWPLEQHTRKGEWRRSGAGKFDVATVTTTDNESQFTRYSRLLCRLKLRELGNDG